MKNFFDRRRHKLGKAVVPLSYKPTTKPQNTMKKWTQIEEISTGDVVLRSNGLKAKPSKIEVLSIEVIGTMAWMTWKWQSSTTHYYSTNFRMSTNMSDYGSWHDLTSQQWGY